VSRAFHLNSTGNSWVTIFMGIRTETWLPFLLIFIDFGLPAGLALLAAWRVRVLLRNRRRTDIVTCAKCGYDMRAASALTCAECGKVHLSREALYPGRRKFRKGLILPVIMCLPAVWVAVFFAWYLPKTYLQNRQTRAILAPLKDFGVRVERPTGRPKVLLPRWTVFVAKGFDWALPDAFGSLYGGGLPEYEELTYPRAHMSPDLELSLIHTVASWTWQPSLNYVGYYPLERCGSIRLTSTSRTLTAGDIQPLSALTDLREIQTAYEVGVSDEAFAALAALPQPDLSLRVHRYEPDPAKGQAWAGTKGIKALRDLIIEAGKPVSQEAMDAVAGSPNLRFLIVKAPAGVSDPVLANGVFRFKSLESLAVYGLDLEPGQLKQISANSRLERLAMHMPASVVSRVSDEDLGWMGAPSGLSSISLVNMPRVTGAFLAGVPDRNLRLTLYATGFDDSALKALAARKGVRALHLKNSAISVEALKDYLRTNTSLDSLEFDKPPDVEMCRLIAAHPRLEYAFLSGVNGECAQVLAGGRAGLKISLLRHNLTAEEVAAIRAAAWGGYPPRKAEFEFREDDPKGMELLELR
jgi:hypothetical protein